MRQRILRYFKHLTLTLLGLLTIGLLVIVALHGSVEYGNDPLRHKLDGDGPYVFYPNDSTLQINYLRGNREDGFFLDRTLHRTCAPPPLSSYFAADGSSFRFRLDTTVEKPPAAYADGEPIFAVSDIESGYRTFRDLLIAQRVIDAQLNWTFGRGHLVLVGDFMDRGFSTTQVLWFAYKLEQEARMQGGRVHFILGNHELYNLQGKFDAASYKYDAVAAVLGVQPHELYSDRSVLGRWLISKNSIERINGVLFAHGGLPPEIARYETTLEEINRLNRKSYRHPYYPKPEKNLEQLVSSNRKGICWYRGYFKDSPAQEEVRAAIEALGGRAIVVGHTIQWKVNRQYDGWVYAIDVKHPKDYNHNWPAKESEGLYIDGATFYRALADGSRVEL